eukprot:3229023-Pyramimonas_sp.AAC.1
MAPPPTPTPPPAALPLVPGVTTGWRALAGARLLATLTLSPVLLIAREMGTMPSLAANGSTWRLGGMYSAL